MDTKMMVSKAPKAKVMLWTDVSFHDMEQIDKMQSLPDLESTLCNVLWIDVAEPKGGVLLELYVHTVLFCRKNSFTKEQTSALLSIIKSVHEVNAETPLDNIEQSFKYCKDLLLCHSVRRPPFSINLFSPEEAGCVLKYIYDSYVRHYKVYKYVFTPQVKLDLSLIYSASSNQNESVAEDSPLRDAEDMLEPDDKERDSSPETQEATTAGPGDTSLGSKLELKSLIEKEIREQMTLMSGQLDQRIKEMADQHKSVSNSPEQNNKSK